MYAATLGGGFRFGQLLPVELLHGLLRREDRVEQRAVSPAAVFQRDGGVLRADMDEKSDPFYDPPVASFRFDFPAHISFIPYRDEKTGKPKMAERSTFDDLIAFFYLDLTRGIAAGNLPRRCKNCGHWFVAVGGYNTQYCDRPILGQHGKTCRSVGAHETAKRKLREAAAKEYARTYNRLKGRKQRGTISTDEWNHIVAVAEELRAAFQAGEMAESEYCRKLKAL